jgi:hypothetical protein
MIQLSHSFATFAKSLTIFAFKTLSRRAKNTPPPRLSAISADSLRDLCG